MRISLALVAVTLTTANAAFQEGDECGVTASDFVNVDFSGDYLVAGEAGCTLGEGMEQCYCAPNLTDGERRGTFEWQCGGKVNFGPAEGKQCPETVPVPKNSDILGLVPKQTGDRTCDPAIHPSGQPGDEVCPYSECDEGGDTSAICACLDVTDSGEFEWVCLHSTCACEPVGDGEETATTSSASKVIAAIVPFAIVGAMLWN